MKEKNNPTVRLTPFAIAMSSVGVLIVILVAFVSTGGGRKSTESRLGQSIPASCPPAPSPLPSSVNVATGAGLLEFTETCYYAPASQPFTVTFENKLVGSEDGTPLPINLALFRKQSDAVTVQGGQYRVSDELAIARAPEAVPPATVSMDVPALEPGVYFLLGQEVPKHLFAYLIVGVPSNSTTPLPECEDFVPPEKCPTPAITGQPPAP